MITVEFKPIFHLKEEKIALIFPVHNSINSIIKTIEKIKWSKTHHCWYIPMDKTIYQQAVNLLKDKAIVSIIVLKEYLELRKNINSIQKETKEKQIVKPQTLITYNITESNMQELDVMVKTLKLKAYSSNTIRLYRTELLVLMRIIGNNSIKALTINHLKSYLLWLIETKKYSENKVHTTINSLKFYYEQVLHQQRFFLEVPRPKKPFQLPTVHAQKKIKQLIETKENIKHKTMLMTAYAGGLRVSEVVNLTIKDVDSDRMLLYIRQAKGKKDRQVPLSVKLLDQLRLYYKEHLPINYLFEGQEKGEKYSIRSLQQVFKDAKDGAGILQKGGIHSLRHSYATHLLEQGTDIKIIQELLGHNNINTTIKYTHVSKRHIANIQSPLDKIEW